MLFYFTKALFLKKRVLTKFLYSVTMTMETKNYKIVSKAENYGI